MEKKSLRGIRACVFDAYGTLFDVNSATAPCLRELGEKADALNRLWREKQLQYSWLRACQGKHADFWQVTGDALDFALRSLGIGNDELRRRPMHSYLALGAYPEVPDTLAHLKKGVSHWQSFRMERRKCCRARWRTPSSIRCWMRFSQWRKPASINPIRECIVLPRTVWG